MSDLKEWDYHHIHLALCDPQSLMQSIKLLPSLFGVPFATHPVNRRVELYHCSR
jgi:hypothetical protein